jgi:uncharacterized protein (DUF433 family)
LVESTVAIGLRQIAAMNGSDLTAVDPDVLGGTPVFKGTRVPVRTLFDYLEDNYSLDEFVECFPSVTREMACRVLERSEAALLTPASALLPPHPIVASVSFEQSVAPAAPVTVNSRRDAAVGFPLPRPSQVVNASW